MLLNAFKSIYRQAYVKGIASAVVLTAGLAAGQANAESYSATTSGDFIVDGSTNTLKVTSDITNNSEIKVTFASGEGSDNYVSGAAVTAEKQTWVINNGATLKVADSASSDASVSLKQLDVLGTLTLDATNSSGASVSAAIVNVGSDQVLTQAQTASAKVSFGSDDNTLGKIAKSGTVDIYEGSTVHNVYGDAEYDLTSGGTVQGASLKVYGGKITVDSSNGSAAASINVADGVMNDGTITVGSGDTLTFEFQDLATELNEEGNAGTAFAQKVFSVEGGTLNVAGTLKITDGSVVANSEAEGVFDLSNDDVVITAADTQTGGDATIQASGAGAVLRISEQNISEFLDITEGVANDAQGKLFASSRAVFEFAGQDNVTLNDYKWTSGAAAGSIAIDTATIRGANLTINEQLKKNASDAADMKAATIESTSSLTIGSAIDSLDGIAKTGAITKVVAEGDLNLQNSSFTINVATDLGDLDPSTDKTVADTTAGTLYGQNLTVSHDVKIEGNYNLDVNSITLTSGDVTVGNGKFANVTTDATVLTVSGPNDVSITVSGAAPVYVQDIEVDNSATLNLSNVTEFAHNGTDRGLATVKADEFGTVKVNASALSDVLTGEAATSGWGFIASKGTVEVTGSIDLDNKMLVSGADASGGVFTFDSNNGGTLKIDGSLELAAEDNADGLDIGASGSIIADEILVSNDGTVVYGLAVAEDTGVRGNIVDLYYNTYEECINFGRRGCTVYILE